MQHFCHITYTKGVFVMSTKSKIPSNIFPTTPHIIIKTGLHDAADTDIWDQLLEMNISNEYYMGFVLTHVKMSSLLVRWPLLPLSWTLNLSWFTVNQHLVGIQWQQARRRLGYAHEKERLNSKNSTLDWQLLHCSCFLFFLIAHLLPCCFSFLTLSSDS